MFSSSQLVWLISTLVMIGLYALALRISVAAIADKSGRRNSYGRAFAIAFALALVSSAVRHSVAELWLGAAIVLAIWFLVVRWAYSLSWVQTLLVAVMMLLLSLGIAELARIVAAGL